MGKVEEVIKSICESEGLTTVEVLEKYPDLKRLKHEEELQEKKVIKENKRLLKESYKMSCYGTRRTTRTQQPLGLVCDI